MPTASEYRAAAHRMRAAADRIVDQAAQHQSWGAVEFVGPGPARPIEDGLWRVRRELGAASVELLAAAAECDRRAAVCEAFAMRWAEHRRLSFVERVLTPPPRRPAPWVEL